MRPSAFRASAYAVKDPDTVVWQTDPETGYVAEAKSANTFGDLRGESQIQRISFSQTLVGFGWEANRQEGQTMVPTGIGSELAIREIV